MLTVGWYNAYMRDSSIFSTSSEGGRELSPEDEYKLVKALRYALQGRPYDWSFNAYYAKDTRTGIEIWTANGMSFISIYRPVKIKLRTCSQWRLYWLLKRTRKAKPNKGFSRADGLFARLLKANREIPAMKQITNDDVL
jgi:hypothetical protein